MNIILRITLLSSLLSSYAMGMFNQLPQLQSMMIRHYKIAQNHEERIEQNTSDIQQLKDDVQQLKSCLILLHQNNLAGNGQQVAPVSPAPISRLATAGGAVVKTFATVGASLLIRDVYKAVIPEASPLIDGVVNTGALYAGSQVAQSLTLSNVKWAYEKSGAKKVITASLDGAFKVLNFALYPEIFFVANVGNVRNGIRVVRNPFSFSLQFRFNGREYSL